ncbi:MAG: secondary thiamine-phosphate synthase enzyme [Candidatus Nealsonbacteria bacterium CG_4_9_14_0_2_um_filter_37_38]|uniref:Secondary thiamine-phosphate synthase enzyme n=1 Tax=Candidatus Nealsonbacteria bacterium CG_4_10_14_0_8_um_filter_37_14 TaxID=1974684 RepID=A0A2M7R5Z1_9BACT|nr:MAG: secondary thiamine-phosphate synthase enzyme [Candidatus Nealsonbacteria bacterium CG11_big_fil_rev_8_21_14_0_20_37_68]PIW92060.1 MAG: secondary thiamine-phosphate synthase enzyme [Candidatus Nealsonbacteria bacterium CG_4_8_14_3_um_filter_37_23]PIY88913.1 MAG: secondary thiamine-phosphate synthase enzyme [Candidatus Nealsonbacteria bacterium CG_4_10_14_0_8_um_filter_37_14]PJC51582.1 MAG: secondary thiamine-phosphate synthase enzyme [Candidatus Nealsonbacteria bacterium CG_4_9_14_0_2_um_
MRFSIKTKGFNDVIDITSQVSREVEKSKVKDGLCLVSSPGSTCGITTIEYEDGLIEDLKRILEKIAPMSKDYEHCKKWGDCNGYAHIRSALIKPFLAIPVENGRLVLGQWQNIALLDFDNRPREREIMVKIVGK